MFRLLIFMTHICLFFLAGFDDKPHLTVNTDMATIVKAMAQPDSGLEIRDRMWLKITIPNAFIGKSDSLYRIYVCMIKIEVPHEVKNQLAIAKRTHQIMKY